MRVKKVQHIIVGQAKVSDGYKQLQLVWRVKMYLLTAANFANKSRKFSNVSATQNFYFISA